jgi:hypothetical protein
MLSRPAADDMTFVAVWYRAGTGYAIDLYNHEVEDHLRKVRRHRQCVLAKAYATRAEAQSALTTAARMWPRRRYRHRRYRWGRVAGS